MAAWDPLLKQMHTAQDCYASEGSAPHLWWVIDCLRRELLIAVGTAAVPRICWTGRTEYV